MEALEVMAEAVIDTLKQFSKGKRPLTSATLQEAFYAREDIVALFNPAAISAAGAGPGRVSIGKSVSPEEQDSEYLSGFREVFLKILNNLGPMIKDDYEERYSELQNKIDSCDSLLPLSQLAKQISQMVGELISHAVERVDYSNAFLVDLGKDLYRIDEQLASYQNYRKEGSQISNEFHDTLLSHTDDMHRVVDSGESLADIRNIITSKLNIISTTIETNRQIDGLRGVEADTRIIDLQNDLRIYKDEILKVRERSEILEQEILLDSLTQLNNRRAYDLQIRESLRRYRRNGEQFSLILIDIDHFKNVNDEYGHKAGDKCLREIARLIRSSLRQSDFFARYGGEELIAILHGSNAANGFTIAEKIRRRIEMTRLYYQDQPIPITISLGVTEVMPSDKDPETPFIRVDQAMYGAKREGRNRVHVITDLPIHKIDTMVKSD